MIFMRPVFCVFLFLVMLMPGFVYASNRMSNSHIIINLPSKTLELYSEEVLQKQYPVAIGRASTVTPVGHFIVMEMDRNPSWYPPEGGEAVPSGPENPLGYRWIEFAPSYGIHGTNMPNSIGRAVSHGCVRMLEDQVEELFELVIVGTPVDVTYERIRSQPDGSDKVMLSVYPDVYYYQELTPADIRSYLEKQGWTVKEEDIVLQELITETGQRSLNVSPLSEGKESNVIQGKMKTTELLHQSVK